ncbi:MAG: hypothetical protein U0Z17_02015 [Bacteroidales bacterium]
MGKTIVASADAALFSSLPFNGDASKLKVMLGNYTVLYNADRTDLRLSRPVEMPAGFDWKSLYGQYLQGREWDKQRAWADAEKCYQNCLASDPNYLPALTAMANLMTRSARYQEALTYATRAISIDTYDAAANFIYGVVNARLKKYTDAVDGFSIASAALEYRAASYVEMSKLFLLQNQPGRAKEYAMKAAVTNPMEVPAFELLAVIARLQSDQMAADKALAQLEALDPLDHLVRFEKKYLAHPSNDMQLLLPE